MKVMVPAPKSGHSAVSAGTVGIDAPGGKLTPPAAPPAPPLPPAITPPAPAPLPPAPAPIAIASMPPEPPSMLVPAAPALVPPAPTGPTGSMGAIAPATGPEPPAVWFAGGPPVGGGNTDCWFVGESSPLAHPPTNASTSTIDRLRRMTDLLRQATDPSSR